MKVAMVTPLDAQSAIADVMLQAVPRLAQDWDLDVWAPSGQSLRRTSAPVRLFDFPDSRTVQQLGTYDLVVYVLGDSAYHSRILPLARQLPGLVVLHDASMTNLVRHTAIESGTMPELLDRLRATHGDRAADVMQDTSLAGDAQDWLRFCSEVRLDDFVAETSLGAVVHSRWHAGQVDGYTLGDVTIAPLPVPSPPDGEEEEPGDEVAAVALDNLPGDAVLLVTVGSLNANRRVDQLLRAVADDPMLTRRVHLWSVGPATDAAVAEADTLAADLGIGASFRVTGRVSDSVLHQILARADIAAALRDPVLEGQSASVLTQMLSETPAVVYDHGHYSELPDEAVVKVAPQEGVAGLAAALRSLVDDPDDRVRRGSAARDHVRDTRTGNAYAEAMLVAGERALAARPHVRLAQDLHGQLQRLDLHRHAGMVDLLTETAFDLYDLD